MARRDSLGERFDLLIGKRVRQTVYEKTLVLMKDFSHRVLMSFFKNQKYWDITGNTTTSFAVGVFYKGKLVHTELSADYEGDPTMPTLRKGQTYPLGEYYGGGEAGGEYAPYKGTYGHGGQWGPTLGISRLRRQHSRVRDTWNVVAVCPVEYAAYNTNIYRTLEKTKNDFPDLFSAGVVYVRRSSVKKVT